MYADRLKKFTELYKKLTLAHNGDMVFTDFVKLCAISIYNSFAKSKEMEQEYLTTIKKYEKKYQDLFPQMFGQLIMMYEESDDIVDILGPFYERKNLGQKSLGQFFTPAHISEFISEISLGDEKNIKRKIEENGFLTMSDPACGAGRSVACFCQSIEEKKYKLPKRFTYNCKGYI